MEKAYRYPNLSREQLEDIIYNIPDSITVMDQNSRFLLANKTVEESQKMPLSKLLQMDYQQLEERNPMKTYPHKLNRLYQLSSKRDILYMGTSPDWKWPTFFTIRNIFDEEGNFLYSIHNGRSQAVMNHFLDLFEKMQKRQELENGVVKYLNQAKLQNNEIIAESLEMKQLLTASLAVAPSDSTVTIIGESGTGKEVLANFIHQNSSRNQKPFLPVNCSAIPQELMEAEFFGYEKGAFTGANPRGSHGLFELADGGTLFLDEIGEMPLSMQPKLLRVLETGEVRPIGADAAIKVNVRIIAATNRNLMEMVEQKRFREDLYYRLQIIPLALPPLRERKADILPLAQYFLKKYNQKYQREMQLTKHMEKWLTAYSWPGNIRELRNLIERYVLIANLDAVESLFALPREPFADAKGSALPAELLQQDYRQAMEHFEKMYIEHVLEETRGNVNQAAALMGIHRSVLYKKIKKLAVQ